MYTDRDDQLDRLLRTSIESLDITEQEYELAVARYTAVGGALKEYWDGSPAGGEVYPQGSMRLGTVTRNIHRNDEIDIDLVARRDLDKSSVTQAQLKEDVGAGLEQFIASDPEGDPGKEEGKRCWTLQYAGFHLDVLPALPDQISGGTTISITDTEVRRWLPSNPIGFAAWFHNVMRTEWLAKRVLAEKQMGVADVPEWAIKTTLQRTVQALKRHRDIFFTRHLDDRPASVILTTLAARAYRGDGPLYEVLRDVTAALPRFAEEKDGIYVVANPVQPEENFADRWQSHPERATQFFQWAEQAAADFAGLGSTRGIDAVLERVAKAFGERPAKHAERAAGSGLFESRRGERLAMSTGTGMLAAGGNRPVQTHTFYGVAGAQP